MDGGQPYNPRTVEEVFRDFKGRRAGMIKALTIDVEEFYQQCVPEKENLCLYGFPSEQWEVKLPAEEVPPELPEPALGINFARDGMQEKDWVSLVAVHSDAWLLAVAFYFGARFGFDKADRKLLFNMINDLPTIFEVVTGTAEKQTKGKPSGSDHSSDNSKSNSKKQNIPIKETEAAIVEEGERERELKGRRLREAAIEGSVRSLTEIVAEDGLILDRIVAGCFEGSSSNPLHTAASYGHTEFVKELLRLNADLSQVLDSQHRTALHLASSKGHLEIVGELIKAGPGTCLARDRDGRNPLHVAAVSGQVKVLEELARANPNAARVRVDGGETILHQCVNHNQLKTLEVLLKMEMIRGQELVNTKDIDGNTILHLAVSSKQFEIAKHVLKNSNIDVNSTNINRRTAMDILFITQNSRKDHNDGEEDPEELNIEDFLREAKARRAKDLVESDWLTKKRDALMVVASLIATMAFQAGLNPPGGVWQDNSESGEYRAGEAVMAYNYSDWYPYFLRSNTIGFVASLSTILLLISGLPFRKRAYMFALVVIMWLTITSMAFTYAFSIVVVTPKKDREPLSHTIVVAVIVWCCVMGLLLLLHTVRLVAKLVEEWSRNKAIDGFLKFSKIPYRRVQHKALTSLIHGGRSHV